ncbi:phenazine biosynthesis protein PhzF [Curtobacterium sp. MCPF17_047]|uniref:PhzF family phenazine biosynthesis protein n=2 Tax=unclassified Curtobacterium TaxID=257496 RepID=UPI000DAA0095|nr:PhzF family phenazine biosynthesis protein [Curtobacterium sp. MCPF17_047]PZF61930.1 phenazine biosynthesis protein PhzF [Curtobacterium sp. MCPF17_047]
MQPVEVLRYTAFADPEAGGTGGNPAGVVLDAAGLGDDEMLAIARRVGYSETAFVTGVVGDRVRVRYFSPAAEVPFCGHATVALAVAIAERQGAGRRVFATASGDVVLRASDTTAGVQVAMTSVGPATRGLPDERLMPLLAVLGLTLDDLDAGHPPLEAFAGNWHPVLVLADQDLFHQFRFAPDVLAELMRRSSWPATVTVLHPVGPGETAGPGETGGPGKMTGAGPTPAAGPAVYEARNLFPVGRITEDPATGSAAASVGAYLRAVGRASAGDRVVIRQGRHVGRPSLLLVDVPAAGGVTVTGGATPIR